MKILISPFSAKINDNNAKNYPYWQEFVKILKNIGHETTQIGISKEQDIGADLFIKDAEIKTLSKLLAECFAWISVDNFFPHFVNSEIGKAKPGMVIWSRSDPEIFGYSYNVNVLKNKKYLRADQFGKWDVCQFIKESFYLPNELIEIFIYHFEKQ